MKSDLIKTRFAPSPTGRLHLGNLRTALFNALFARAHGGVFLLRSEDTDAARSRVEYLEAIMRDLQWLGLPWQEGPQVGGVAGPYLQSERAAIYADYYARLMADERAYPCFCSESELRLERKLALQSRRPPRYSGRCAKLDVQTGAGRVEAGEAHTLRFRVPAGRDVEFVDLVRGPQRMRSDDIGDFVIRRTDGTPAFFFSNALDDALMGITHVLRGEDHLTNTPRQLLLLEALALPAPDYGHISMIVDGAGGPLSKRSGSASLGDLRAAGFLPIAIVNHLARLGHHCSNDELLDLGALAAEFKLEQLGRAPARHDEQQLLHWQKLAVGALDDHAMKSWLRDWHRHGESALAVRVPADRLDAFLAAVRDNLVLPGDALRLAEAWFDDDPPVDDAVRQAIASAGAEFFAQAEQAYEGMEQSFADFARRVRERSGRGGKQLFMPLRAALTYALHGPEMGRVLPLLEAERVRARLRRAHDMAAS